MEVVTQGGPSLKVQGDIPLFGRVSNPFSFSLQAIILLFKSEIPYMPCVSITNSLIQRIEISRLARHPSDDIEARIATTPKIHVCYS